MSTEEPRRVSWCLETRLACITAATEVSSLRYRQRQPPCRVSRLSTDEVTDGGKSDGRDLRGKTRPSARWSPCGDTDNTW